jgi:hypothetical protein
VTVPPNVTGQDEAGRLAEAAQAAFFTTTTQNQHE